MCRAPRSGGAARPPAVAGTFYPDDPDQLARSVDELLPEPPTSRQVWSGAMVPHAGLVYSGRLAAAVLRESICRRPSSSSAQNTLGLASNGRLPRTNDGRCPARKSHRTRPWPRPWPTPSPAWSWTPRPTPGSTRSKSNCHCWPGWRPLPGSSASPSEQATCRGAESSPPAWPASLRARDAPHAAARLQRHEPLCQRRRNTPARPTRPRRRRAPRPRAALRNRPPRTHQYVRPAAGRDRAGNAQGARANCTPASELATPPAPR